MNERIDTVPADVEYHRVLAGEKRRIGRGILTIVLLIGGMVGFSLLLNAAVGAVDAAIRGDEREMSLPLAQAVHMVSVAFLIPWSMLLQRWLYGVRGASLTSVISRFRFDIFGRALVLVVPAWIVLMTLQSLGPIPESPVWTNTDVLWFIVATLLLTPLQAAGEEYGLRGLVFRVAGGWARGARAGLVVGILVSSAVFAVIHLATDMWLNLWYLIFAVGTALITWRTGGLEVAIVLHAGLNTLAFTLQAALRQDLQAAADRSAGAVEDGLLTLGPAAVIVLATVVVWVLTRRSGPARTPRAAATVATREAARSVVVGGAQQGL